MKKMKRIFQVQSMSNMGYQKLYLGDELLFSKGTSGHKDTHFNHHTATKPQKQSLGDFL